MNINCFVILKKLSLFLVFVRFSFGLECDSSGISCISCTDYQICNGGVPEGEVISCKAGKACSDSDLEQCWIKLDCYGANNCTEVGIFPNVMVESDYFVCLGDPTSGYMKYEYSCPEGNFFDNGALMCTPKAATETVTEPSLGTATTHESSASTSVTDLTSSIPSSSEAPATTSFPSSSETPATTSFPVSSETPATSSITTSTQTPTPPTTTSTSTTETSPTCIASGIYPYPSNCKMYYRCSTSLKLFLYICPGTSYFNENILKCSMVITLSCQEQIQKNSTATTKPPTTTASTSTKTTLSSPLSTTTTTSPPITAKTTPSTTITTTTTTTTISPLPTPFKCTTAGTFENPVDCKTYYRCSSSGKPFLYTCPGSSYFNELTKRCSMVITPRCKSLIQG